MKKRKFIQRMISLLLAITLLCALALTASAASVWLGVDDDDAQGHSNASYGPWSRVYSSNLKYGEGLITSTGLYNGRVRSYEWLFKNAVLGYDWMGIEAKVWLYHSSFNDPEATYAVKVNNILSYTVGTVNQNTAPAGWTKFPKKEWPRPGLDPGNSARGIILWPSSDSSAYTCGADWIEATVYY